MLDCIAMNSQSPALHAVRQHYLFAGLSERDFDGLAAQMTLSPIDKGEVLFLRGDTAESFFYVIEGQIELGLTTPTGEKKVIEVFGPNRTFAEAITFMRRKMYPANAQALVDSKLVRVPNQAYVEILYGNPDACMRLLGDVCQHLHARVVELERSTIHSARSRLASYLLDRVPKGEISPVTVELDLPRHVLASRLSIKPETLSRCLRQLQDSGILVIEDRNITVPDPERLREQIQI